VVLGESCPAQQTLNSNRAIMTRTGKICNIAL
jgi:hypothetical protein